MIGNNSCGATAQRTGKVVDNIVSFDVLLYDAPASTARRLDDPAYAALVSASGRASRIHRTRGACARTTMTDPTALPRHPATGSGYNLDSLLPEHGFAIASLLVGSEGLQVTVLRAELELVPVVEARTLVVLGYPDIAAAADAVPAIVEPDPICLSVLWGIREFADAQVSARTRTRSSSSCTRPAP